MQTKDNAKVAYGQRLLRLARAEPRVQRPTRQMETPTEAPEAITMNGKNEDVVTRTENKEPEKTQHDPDDPEINTELEVEDEQEGGGVVDMESLDREMPETKNEQTEAIDLARRQQSGKGKLVRSSDSKLCLKTRWGDAPYGKPATSAGQLQSRY